MTALVRRVSRRRRAGVAYLSIFAVMTLLVALWASVGIRRAEVAVVASASEDFGRARVLFDRLRARTLASLMAQCRVLVEDPRLKASLATEGVDAATVTDILGDINRLRRNGFLLVLSAEARVFAEAGADELRGLDLSASSVMSRARGANDAVGGTWVIGGKLIDLAVTSVRFDRSVLAYLVVGEAVDRELVQAVEDGAGVAVAVVAGAEPGPVSTAELELRAVFSIIAAGAGARPAHVVERGGERYATAVFELEGTPQTHPRLAMARALAPQHRRFEPAAWWLWLIYGIVLVGVTLGAAYASHVRS